MMRLIDIDALKEKEQYIPCGNGLLFHGVTAATIDAMPVVDARPVLHARWVKQDDKPLDGNYYCEVCGHGVDIATGEETPIDRDLLYCPHCGAQMDGGVANEH